MALFIVERVGTGFSVRPGENTLQAAASALTAEGWADAAALSAATAEAAAGPTYASTAAGLAATTSGESFAVDAGGGLVSVYLNSSGTAVLQRTLATTGALAASGGSALVGFLQSGTGATARTAQSKLRDTVSVKDFGAVGDGVTDDTAAIQAAFDAAVASGASSVFIPSGNYIVGSQLNLTGARGFTLYGAGYGIDAFSGKASKLIYTSNVGSLLAFDSCAGLQVSNIVFQYDNVGFGGDLVTTNNTGGLDTTNFCFSTCVFQGKDISTFGAASLLRLEKSIIGSVENCVFKYARFAIAIYAYVNVVSIEKCTFLRMLTKNIYAYTGSLEMISVIGNTFEPTIAGRAHGFEIASGQSIKTFVYEKNWHGDIGTPGGFWVLIGDSTAVSIAENNFGSAGGGVNDYAVYIGACDGWTISGNTFFDKAINFTSGCSSGVVSNNFFTAVSNTILNRTAVSNSSTWVSNFGLDPYGQSKAYLTSTQAIANSTFTPISFDGSLYDEGSVHSTTVTPSRFTVPIGNAGLWTFKAAAYFDTSTAGSVYIMQIRKNGSTIIAQTTALLSASAQIQPTLTADDIAVDGDYYELYVWHNKGSPLNILGSVGLAVDTYMAAYRAAGGS